MRNLLPILVLAASATGLRAQGWIEPAPRVGPAFGVVKTRTAVTVRVSGRVARVEVEEWFQNRGGGLGEGDYLYPLPGEAVFSNFSLFQGDEELTGETMDANQARRIYEEIVRRKRDPALIELAGHGLVRARVFPINPGETRKITLRYTQVLARAGDALQFRYAAGGRTTRPTPARIEPTRRDGPETSRPLPERVADVPVSFLMTVDSADQFRDAFSPTHTLDVSRRGGRMTVRPHDTLSGDLAVFLPLARGAVGITVVTHRPDGEQGYFMLTLSPGDPREAAAPRDLTVVVDVSGSMSGQKLTQAKQALQQLLGSLSAGDRFRLIAFSSAVRSQAGEWSAATPAALDDARSWVDALRAEGGTNVAGALAEAFRLTPGAGRLPIVLFLTDGLPSVGERNPERLAEQAEQDRGSARVFAFGIGYDVNTYLLDRLSAAGRGATAYVEPQEDVEQAVGTLVAKIRHPVLTDLSLDAGARIEEVYPERLPDLFSGEELVVFGRYRNGRRQGRVTVSGTRNGRTERYSTEAAFPERENGNDFIPKLWAARKLGVLQQAVRLHGANPELIAEIRETALRYGLLSEYTSYLVQEPDAFALRDGEVRGGAMNRALPATAPSSAVGAGAVTAAKSDRARREVASMAQLAEADEQMLARGHMPQAQHVGGRVFTERNGVWTDLLHADSLPVVTVEPFSPAYFELLKRLPELAPILERFDRVVVAGRRVSLRFDAGGMRTASEAADVVARFRAP